MKTLELAKGVLQHELEAIRAVIENLDSSFEEAINLILKSEGKLIVTGMGKSGIIATKISATLTSTGTPSIYLHPGEAFHGGLGIIQEEDIVLAISHSGETEEILRLIPFLKDNGNTIISMTKNKDSSLGKNSDFHIHIPVEREAGCFNLAPTASTTAALAMGDAVAMTLMELRGFKPENFAKFHPGGSLGRKLLTKVKDVMKTEGLPFLAPGASNLDLIALMAEARYGFVIIANNGKILGIVTDGDLRRGLNKYGEKFLQMSVEVIMTKDPITIDKEKKIQEAERIMRRKKISCLIVEEGGECLGIVMLRDMMF